ncbi:universal stress protein [Actinophytocola oryzae]|uniref:Nucleotide-binding universal stress UspA family protein n=1 Tax=Actinophytocola oryzae TaxID=502181 RepID=A0A4R7W3L9_9PSEU|nr:universal stress protein [Actinophytocola oryzae]TDV57243.1 nucleotide-binding universal stress UspA family protein [Actinophytocola oryzae]
MSGSAAAFESTVEHMGPRPDPAARAILVGVDGSDTAMRAAAFAIGLARRQGYRLIVTFVAAHSALTVLGPGVAAAQEAVEELDCDLRAAARNAADELRVPIAFLRTYGDPFTRLREAADDCQVDTVVVGASMSAGHRFAGSVATKLIRAGHWPVLVVP